MFFLIPICFSLDSQIMFFFWSLYVFFDPYMFFFDSQIMFFFDPGPVLERGMMGTSSNYLCPSSQLVTVPWLPCAKVRGARQLPGSRGTFLWKELQWLQSRRVWISFSLNQISEYPLEHVGTQRFSNSMGRAITKPPGSASPGSDQQVGGGLIRRPSFPQAASWEIPVIQPVRWCPPS